MTSTAAAWFTCGLATISFGYGQLIMRLSALTVPMASASGAVLIQALGLFAATWA